MKTDEQKYMANGPLGGYFEKVGKFSEEHMKDMDKFHNLLKSMENKGKSPREANAYTTLHETVRNFDTFMVKHSIVLSEIEKGKITLITGSSHSPLIKKRMLEDLIHKIKERHQSEKNKLEEDARIKIEINELKASRNYIIDWFKLVKFSMDYGTITIFSHRLRDSAFSIIRKNALNWQQLIERNIKEVLDTGYYLLSTLEYNSLEAVTRFKKPLEALAMISSRPSYDYREISSKVDEFAALYITLTKNSEYAISSYNKIFKERKAEHGLLGGLMGFLDKPIFENKPLMRTDYEIYTDSITGFLLSYYTSREGIPIRTANQVLYLIASDGKLDDSKKHLTAGAYSHQASARDQKRSDDVIISERLEEIQRITDEFLNRAAELEEKIFKTESKSMYQAYLNDIKKKPIIRIIRLAEAYINYFVDLINNKEIFILNYDNNEYKNYFDIDTTIQDISLKYSMEEFNLIGSRLKDLHKLSTSENSSEEELVKLLTDQDTGREKLKPSIEMARNAVFKISDMSYRIAVSINELISFYINQKELVYEKLEKNYDFFLNSSIKKNSRLKLNRIFQGNTISLKDFLEMASAMGFHIAGILNHPGMKAVIAEKESLMDKLAGSDSRASGKDDEGANEFQNLEKDDRLLNDIDKMYMDSLTGLWKKEYFADQVFHRLYDNSENYRMDTSRFVFLSEILGFSRINSVYGLETGDKLLVQVTRKVLDEINKPGKHEDDIIIRESSGIILGYLNNTTLMECADRLKKIALDIKGIYLRSGDLDLGKIVVNFGVYEERKGSNYKRNIDIASNLLFYANLEENRNTAFIKDPNFIIRDRDFARIGDLKVELVTII